MNKHAGIQIIKGVPLPPSQRAKGESKYPFGDMGIGDSFIFPETCKHPRQRAVSYGKFFGRRFVTRKLPDGRIGCWRIA